MLEIMMAETHGSLRILKKKKIIFDVFFENAQILYIFYHFKFLNYTVLTCLDTFNMEELKGVGFINL